MFDRLKRNCRRLLGNHLDRRSWERDKMKGEYHIFWTKFQRVQYRNLKPGSRHRVGIAFGVSDVYPERGRRVWVVYR
jgi:hypothetical protein